MSKDHSKRQGSKGAFSSATINHYSLCVAVDIVGPIEPRSNNRSRYILTIMDYATHYPEAIALPSIETELVAEA